MDNKKFSLDDILNEFAGAPTSRAAAPETNEDFAAAPENTSRAAAPEIIELPGEEYIAPDLSDIKIGLTSQFTAKIDLPEADAEKAEEDNADISPKEFREKYEELEYKTAEELNITEAKRKAVTPKRIGGVRRSAAPRGFSRKQESDYTEERKGTPESDRSFSDKLEGANLYFKSDRYVIEGDNAHSKAWTDESAKPKRINRGNTRAIADILNEYPHENKSVLGTISTTYHKAITGFFTKIMPKTAEMPEKLARDLHKDPRTAEQNRGIDAEGNIYPDEHDTAGLISKSNLYSDAGRKYAPKKDIPEPQYRGRVSDLNLKSKLAPKILNSTASFDEIEEAKLRELAERRQDKIKEFRLVGSEEEEAVEEREKPLDFDSYDSTRRVAAGLQKNLRRYVLSAAILFVLTVISLIISAVNDTLLLETPQFINKITNTDVFLVINAVLGIAAGIAAFSTVNSGVSKLLDGAPDSDTLVSLTLAGSVLLSFVMFVDTNMVKFGLVQIIVPVAIAALFANVCGKILLTGKAKKNFKIFSGARNKYALFAIDDIAKTTTITRGLFTTTPTVAAYKETEFASDFLKKTGSHDIYDRFCKRSLPFVMIAGVVGAIVAALVTYKEQGLSCIYVGISMFFTLCAVASGFIGMFIVGMPFAIESARMNTHGSVMPGFDGVEEFSDSNAILLDAQSLFPHGSIALLGVKLFTDTRLDEAIVEAASLTHQAGSILDTMFYDIIRGKTELLNPVESFIYEDSMGLCGWINNKRVLLGNRSLMINHSINGLPTEAKEAEYTGKTKSAVYLSIAGELSAMFIVDLIPNIEIADALLELQKKSVSVILRTVDSMLSIAKISDMFDVSPEYIRILPFRHNEMFEEITEYTPKISANAVVTGNITGIASVFTAAKKIRASAMSGLILQMTAMIIGFIVIIAMTVFGDIKDISVVFLAAYNTVFVIILALMQAVGRLFP
jgi:Cu+-exporting ATPase